MYLLTPAPRLKVSTDPGPSAYGGGRSSSASNKNNKHNNILASHQGNDGSMSARSAFSVLKPATPQPERNAQRLAEVNAPGVYVGHLFLTARCFSLHLGCIFGPPGQRLLACFPPVLLAPTSLLSCSPNLDTHTLSLYPLRRISFAVV